MRQEMLGGGLVLTQVTTFRILNPNSLSAFETEKMLW